MYICPFCIKSHDTVQFLKAHCKQDHYAKVQSSCQCQQESCSRKFSDVYALYKHLSTFHEKEIHSAPDVLSKKQYLNAWNTQSLLLPDPLPPKSRPKSVIARTITGNVDNANLTPEMFIQNVTAATASFVANLYSKPSVPRSFAQEMISSVEGFFECFSVIETKYRSTVSNCNPEVMFMFQVVKNVFANFTTEHRTMEYFKSVNYLIEPEEICIGTSFEPRRTDDGRRMIVTNKNLYSVPMAHVFQRFLELPGVYDSIVDNIRDYKRSTAMTSFIQGSLWCSIEKRFEGTVLPLILYYDDFEINNPLGTHRGVHKLGAVYCSIGGIPVQFSSLLENIFLVQLHNSKDYTELGNKQIFSHLINQIIKLQIEGITITIRNEIKKVHFALMYIVGDNLGLNAMFGFTTNFNSNYSCRRCRVEKKIQQIQTAEDPKMLRTADNYAKDVLDQTKGIKEECVFNSIPFFHIVNNMSFDLMHDVFEGVCRYDLGKLLQILIKKEKLLTLETLNNRIKFFDYGTTDSKNVPTAISADAIKNGHIIYSASEMACFLRYFGLLIGDLIPEENQTWKIYIVLRKIVSIILAPVVTAEIIKELKKLTTEHHKLYQQLFDDTLKPKHHLLLHYALAMEQTGPMNQMSCMRFEAKHKQLKETAKAITSRKNPAYTLALKQQLLMNYRFVSRKGFDKGVKVGAVIDERVTDLQLYNDFKAVLPHQFNVDRIRCISWIKTCGTVYKMKMIIAVSTSDCMFGQISYILVDDASTVYFIYKKLKTVRFSEHHFTYEVEETTTSWGFISQENLITYVPCNTHVSPRGIIYVPAIP